MEEWGNFMVDGLCRYIGQTVTIFTTSGGLSGAGFTGVLLSVDCRAVRLLCDVGAAPSCAIGSSCGGPGGGYGYGGGFGCGNNPLGAVAVIPTHAIACFTHNAI